MNPKTPTTCEPTEEQRVCDICGVRYCLLRAQAGRPPSPDHWQRGYTRANERAEGLQAKVAVLEAGAAQTALLKEVDDAAYVQLRTRSLEAEARAEGLAKELAVAKRQIEMQGVIESENAEEQECHDAAHKEAELALEREEAATARVTEMQDRMIAAFGEGTTADQLVAISHEHEARVTELEKRLADKLEAVTASARVEKAEARADKAEAELARLRALPNGLREALVKAEPKVRAALHAMQDPLADTIKRCMADRPHNHDHLSNLRAAMRNLTEAHGVLAVFAAAPLPSAQPPNPNEIPAFKPLHGKVYFEPQTLPSAQQVGAAGHNPEGVEARVLAAARRVIEFYASAGYRDGSLAQDWLDAHPAEGPSAPAARHEGEK